MKSGQVYTKNQIDKLGNTLIFLCDNIEETSKTHLLKLVFIIEEISIKRYGVPFFDLRFDLWKLGPVSKDLYVELSGDANLLSDYIVRQPTEKGFKIIKNKKFSDDEFNDIEIALLKEIANRFKYCTSGELVNFTHKRGSPWYETALQNGLLDVFEKGTTTTTNIEIKLSNFIKDDENKLSFYEANKEFICFSKSLKL